MFAFSLRSLWNRRFTAALTVLAIALSTALILGVERLRDTARDSFGNSASGIDLIVAPRGNSVQILMATVFGLGGTGTGMSWESYEWLKDHPDVAWALPLQMGDNHRGYPVIGTQASYFEHFRHSGGRALSLFEGAFFTDRAADAAVVGAGLAAKFGYRPGNVIVNAHGTGPISFDVHNDAPFTISGVLAPTGTAIDRMVLVSLAGFDVIHAAQDEPITDPLSPGAMPAMKTGHEDPGGHDPAEHTDSDTHHHHPAPDRINAAYIGLHDRTAVLGLQRVVNEHAADPLSAILPAVALTELWGITATAERVMQVMAWAVAVVGMIGMVVMLSAGLEARRREFAILRSVGATPVRIFGLILTEAAVLTATGLILGVALLSMATLLANPLLSSRFGIRLGPGMAGIREIGTLAALFCAGLIAASIPAIRVYRTTLADGLSVRL